ncbi:MAG: AsmA-like C-terminal domain-containing protein, partial [Geminicoccaceae bacterium]
RSERMRFEADVADLVPADLPSLLSIDTGGWVGDLRGVRLPVRASIEGDVGLDGSLSPLHLDMQTSDGVLTLPKLLAAPLEVTSAKLEAVLWSDFAAIDIEDLSLKSGDAALGANGHLSWRDGRIETMLDLVAADVRAEDLEIYWPPALGANVRSWVTENIRTGLATRGKATINLRPDDFGAKPLRDDAVQGWFAFNDLSVRYVDTMPPLTGGSGEVTFNADRMDFTVDSGDNAGVSLEGGTVTITGMSEPGQLETQLQVLADARGSIDQAMALLDHPPLEVAKDLEIAPAQTSGDVTVKLDIRMPLYNDVTDDEVDVLADAVLSNAGINGLPRLGDDVLLTKGAFDLRVEPDVVRVDGSAEINGLPLLIEVREPLVEEAAKRRFRLNGRLARGDLEAAGLNVDGLDGEIGFDATVTETAEQFWIDLDADLANLGVALPGFAWRKQIGEEGALQASIAVADDGPIDIKQFVLNAGELRAVGRSEITRPDYTISALALDEFRFGETAATVRLETDRDHGRAIAIEAETLDLDAMRSKTEAHEADHHADPFHLVMRAGRLRLEGLDLFDVKADAIRVAEGWHSASFLGGLASGDKVALELKANGSVHDLDFRSDDAGALIKALDLGQRLEGGNLKLAATLASQDPVIAEGRLQIDSFTLQDAPLLARLLTVASLTGIGNLLGGEGILVDQLILPYTLSDRILNIKDGLLRGSQLGLTVKGAIDLEQETIDLEGTIIPIYSLNRLIGQVPIIGQILTGSEGRGAFAATYQIKGPHSKPTVFVNPLSILTPGLIRDLFGGGGGLNVEPPDIAETND